ncbi:DUF4760 domain-containing protein [Acinetobacter soli]|uniref:DUF4760 domain-containing protein n=1 Tax=Acinetobacter soli TaxID=487316 RepID=UPI004057132E
MEWKVGTGKKSLTFNWTFFFSFSSFLIALYLVGDDLVTFFKIKTWSPSEWLVFLQLLVFFASAIIAYSTITSSRVTARERATLDTILDDNKDEELYDAKILIHDFNKDPAGYYKKLNDEVSKRDSLAQLFQVDGSKLTENEHEVRKSLIKALNRYEFYAVGINQELFDEVLFKRMHCSNIVRLWEASSTAVNQLRIFAKKDTLFKDLEQLANRWKANPLKSEDIK